MKDNIKVPKKEYKRPLTGEEAAFPINTRDGKWNPGMSTTLYIVTQLLASENYIMGGSTKEMVEDAYNIADEIIKQENERS